MTLPNRMHGSSGPFNEGDLKICPHCKSRYFNAKLIAHGAKIIKVCPMCNKVLPMPKLKPKTEPKPKK